MQGRREKSRFRYGKSDRNYAHDGFKCAQCHCFVCTESGLSGVQNRNHCPYCLWSRHLDLYAAGDRLSACKSLMKPIGLTVKLTRKKYGSGQGELMLIHLCTECGTLSINRIATDDDPQTVITVFENSFCSDNSKRPNLDAYGIHALNAADRNIIQVQLFGYESGYS
jgi:hypothetical protein